ncbi:MAG: YraN family protein [Oscillospiraceae bacterium]|nr:YraN family protein [Oscillospiraceae bacterium]
MTEAKIKGNIGEIAAARYLRDNGFKILAGNYATKTGEIDIIASKDDIIRFIEVKTRGENAMLPPSSAVDREKITNIKSTAAAFIAETKMKGDRRFDIIEVIIHDDGKTGIKYIEDAF